MNTLQGLPLTMLILGESMVNLERIHEDIASITPHSVHPGAPTHTGLSVLYRLSYSTINNSILHFLPR